MTFITLSGGSVDIPVQKISAIMNNGMGRCQVYLTNQDEAIDARGDSKELCKAVEERLTDLQFPNRNKI